VASGVALFVSASGAAWGFFTYFHVSFFSALSAGIIGIVPGVFLLIISEALFVLLEILKEKKEHTKLLTSIDNKLNEKISNN